jgi:hypothetical protein
MPNPFVASTVLNFPASPALLDPVGIYGVTGEKVRTLNAALIKERDGVFVWDGRDDHGRLLPSGVYLLRCQGGNGIEASRLLIAR